jgi:hypothetical protein
MKPRSNLLLATTLCGMFASARVLCAQVPALTTINNPTPAADDLFGGSVAALGTDGVLVGAEGAAEAYLFNLNGALLTSFPIPDPAAGGFGAALTGVGNDQVLIGAYNYTAGTPLAQLGRAYLFRSNGVLLTTFTNPAPATTQAFGWSVAAMNTNLVIISGFANVNKPAPYSGSVYLFNTNGAMQSIFTNPTPAYDGGFGAAVAAVAGDRALVGAPYNNTGAPGAGSAYLFSTNGTLMATFTNPIPAAGDNFGTSVAGVGNDRVLISAIDYGGSKGTGGAAYLFSTNGSLVTTFTNPTPAAGDYFGWSVSAVGNSRVLIGAYQDGIGAFQAGVAYLFTTNGALLNTFTNPTPANQDWFAWSVAGVGRDHVVIGGVWDSTGATRAGSAYLYALPYPSLSIARSNAIVSVSWATAETGLVPQQTESLGSTAAWRDSTNFVSVNGPTNTLQQTVANGPVARFYRLRRP